MMVYDKYTKMDALITKSFKVDSEAWDNFLKAAKSYGATPAELLREMVRHVDAAVKGIQSGRIKTFDGDAARLIRAEFPQLSPFQLQIMADILIQAAKLTMNVRGEGHGETDSPK